MTPDQPHPLVDDYLAALRREAARLPRGQRDELVADIRAHLDASVASARSEADVRNALDALGSPGDIVDAALPEQPYLGSRGHLALTFGILGLVLLVVPLVGWLLAIPFGIAAVVLGRRARGELRAVDRPTSSATGGVVTGAIATAIPVLLFTLIVAARSDDSHEPVPGDPNPALVPLSPGSG